MQKTPVNPEEEAAELRKRGRVVYGRNFILEIETGSKRLEMITLQEAEERKLRETGDLVFAIASSSSSNYGGATAKIREEEIPSEAVAYRIGRHKIIYTDINDCRVLVPVAFYKRGLPSEHIEPALTAAEACAATGF
jgi:exosome complex RNA-binding protein Csl4